MSVAASPSAALRLLDELERGKAELLHYADSLTARQLASRPGKRDWSPLEVIEHLLIVEEMVSQAPCLEPGKARVGVRARVFMALAVGPMRPTVRMPTLPVLEPKASENYAFVKQRCSRARSRIAKMAVTAAGRPLYEAQIVHPMAGAMSAEQALDFLNVHLRYHLKHFPKQPTH